KRDEADDEYFHAIDSGCRRGNGRGGGRHGRVRTSGPWRRAKHECHAEPEWGEGYLGQEVHHWLVARIVRPSRLSDHDQGCERRRREARREPPYRQRKE